MEKSKKKHKKDKLEGKDVGESRNNNRSSQVFKSLQKIVKDDYAKKDEKRNAKAQGKQFIAGNSAATDAASSTKRYKM